MAKRPQFNLPSTKPAAEPAKTEWVYRSDGAEAAPVQPAPTPAAPAASVAPTARVAPTAPVAPAARVAPAAPALPDPSAIVARYSQYAAAAGFIPLPGFGVIASGGLQLRMILELCEHYGVPFSSQLGRSLVAATVGSVAPARMAMSLVPVLGVVTGPSLGYTATWAVGQVFMRHFESGGTLENFKL